MACESAGFTPRKPGRRDLGWREAGASPVKGGLASIGNQARHPAAFFARESERR